MNDVIYWIVPGINLKLFTEFTKELVISSILRYVIAGLDVEGPRFGHFFTDIRMQKKFMD